MSTTPLMPAPALPTIDYIDEPVVSLSAEGEVMFANGALRQWFPQFAGCDSFTSMFRDTPWSRVVRALDRHGLYRFDHETWPTGASDPLPVEVRLTRRASASGTVVMRVRDRSRVVDKERMLHAHAQTIASNDAEIRRARRIEELLDHLQHAVFCIDGRGRIEGPVSKATHGLFGEAFEGQDALTSLYRMIDPKTEGFARLQTALSTTLGEDDLQWELQSDGLPERVRYRDPAHGTDPGPHPEDRILRITYTPVFGADGCLDRIMLVVEDQTESDRLQDEVRGEQGAGHRSLRVIEELAAVDKGDFEAFMATTTRCLATAIEGVRPLGDGGPVALADHLRRLHTAKGNARAFGLSYFATAVHEAEEFVAALQQQLADPDAWAAASVRLVSARRCLGEYGRLGRRVFRIQDEHERAIHFELRGLLIQLDEVLSEVFAAEGTDAAFADAWEAAASLAARIEGVSLLASVEALAEEAHRLRRSLEGPRDRDDPRGILRARYAALYQLAMRLIAGSQISQEGQWARNDIRTATLLVDTATSGARAADPESCTWMHNAAATCHSRGWLFLGRICDRQESLLAEGVDPHTSDAFAALAGQADLFLRLVSGSWGSGSSAAVAQVIRRFPLGAPEWQVLDDLRESGDEIASMFTSYLEASGDLAGTGLSPLARALDLLALLGRYLGADDGSSGRPPLPRTTEIVAANADRIWLLADGVLSGRLPRDRLKEVFVCLNARPIRHVLDRLKTMALDLANSLGKRISLTLEGEHHLLDREQIEIVHEALVHLVRNAIDHGVETPATRAAWGKGEFADVRIVASVTDDEAVFTVSDDGRGLDRVQIRAKGVALGMIDDETMLTDDTVAAMILHPGLSTAASVTQISGRGVGLDVVNAAVRRLGGALTITSQPDRGTSISLRFPTHPDDVETQIH